MVNTEVSKTSNYSSILYAPAIDDSGIPTYTIVMPNYTLRKHIKKVLPKTVFKKIERKGHHAESILYSAKYGMPARKMRFIGVTGTNGKTTTTNMIFYILRAAGYKVALFSSTSYGYLDDIRDEATHMTTVPSPILQKRLREFADKGAEWVVIEMSSHALAQARGWGLPFEIGVMTNVTHEHLDYHGTMERYREDKRQLFKLVAKNRRGFGVVYAEDPSAELFLQTVPGGASYGVAQGDMRASDIVLGRDGASCTATIDGESYHLQVNMPGEFNLQNAMAATLVARHLNISKDIIESGIASLEGVYCRMMPINEGQPWRAIVDYGGTPDAFEKLFAALRPTTPGKLVVVFGSPAERDRLKRPIQGEIAARWCDEVIITEEENRHEPGDQILEEIAVGAEQAGKVRGKDLFLIANRDDAIDFAMTRVSSVDDTVVATGKGNEKTIERGDEKLPWNEPEVMRAAIRKAL